MNYDSRMTIRLNKKDHILFKKWCEEADVTERDIIREIIEAIPERRLKIKKTIVPITNKKLKEIYDYE